MLERGESNTNALFSKKAYDMYFIFNLTIWLFHPECE